MFKKIKLLGQAIKRVKPNVPKTKREKVKSRIRILQQQTKASAAKLAQTLFEKANPQFKGKDFTFKTKTGKTESNKEAYNRIMKQNKKVIGNIVKDAFKEKKATGGRVGKMGGGMMGRRMGYSQGSNGKPISRSKNPGILAMSKTAKGRKVVKERFKFNPNRIVAKKGGKA